MGSDYRAARQLAPFSPYRGLRRQVALGREAAIGGLRPHSDQKPPTPFALDEKRLRPDRLLVEGEADARADGGDDPEAEHDLRLRPGQQLEVMMDRRHQQDAAAEHLEGGDLERDGE